MKKNKKVEVITFKCSTDFKRRVDHLADALDVGVSVMLRDIITRSITGLQTRLDAGEAINTFKVPAKKKGEP